MHGDVRVGVDIDAPPSAVWAVLEPVERHVDWMADAVAIHIDSDQRRGAGTRFRCDTRIGPIRLGDLKPGRTRRLTNAEVAGLFRVVDG